MKMKLNTFAKCFAAGSLLLGTLSALAQQPTFITAPGGIAPNGIGATTSELLFSQPYCDFPAIPSQPRGVYSATNFVAGLPGQLNATATKLFSLPTQAGCSATQGAENYFAISSGLGGFTLNSVYATTPGLIGMDDVYKDGVLFIPNIHDNAPGHAGITFDTVGTFKNALIVTTGMAITGYSSTGALLFTFPAPVAQSAFESATVAPLSNTACPGCLYITSDTIPATSNGSIYTVPANAADGTHPTFVTSVPGLEPEGIQFVPAQPCTLTGTNFSYFVSGYSSGGQQSSGYSNTGALLAYTNAQLAPFVGQALIPVELGGTIFAYNPTTKLFTTFSKPIPVPAASPALYQFEGSSLVNCAPAPPPPPPPPPCKCCKSGDSHSYGGYSKDADDSCCKDDAKNPCCDDGKDSHHDDGKDCSKDDGKDSYPKDDGKDCSKDDGKGSNSNYGGYSNSNYGNGGHW
jgi:hypothetical protein